MEKETIYLIVEFEETIIQGAKTYFFSPSTAEKVGIVAKKKEKVGIQSLAHVTPGWHGLPSFFFLSKVAMVYYTPSCRLHVRSVAWAHPASQLSVPPPS